MEMQEMKIDSTLRTENQNYGNPFGRDLGLQIVGPERRIRLG